jgi:hypothetical protein
LRGVPPPSTDVQRVPSQPSAHTPKVKKLWVHLADVTISGSPISIARGPP